MRYRSLVQQTLHYFARPHEGPRRTPLPGPAAWSAGPLSAEPASWRVQLSADDVAELDRAVDTATACGRPLEALRAEDMPLPTLSPRIEAWREELARGRGFLVIRGIPVTAWGQKRCETFFWGLGQHLGIPGAQNPQGDLLGHVRDQGFDDQTTVRAYRTRTRIDFHCDTADVVGLLCLRTAHRGGRSRIASSVSVYNEILHRRPDLVDELYLPFLLDTKAEGGVRWFGVPPCRHADGQLRTFYHADYFRSVARHPDVPPLAAKRAALLDLYDEIAGSEPLCLEMAFEPGDIQLLNNHTILHGRAAYEDAGGPEDKRHLLRLWLSLPMTAPGRGARRAWAGLAARFAWQRLRQAAS